MSRLDRIVALRQGEGVTAALMFAYSFLAMTSYNILKPITRSKFIDHLGSNNLPYVQLAAGVCIGLLIHVYVQAITRLPRRWVIPITQTTLAAILLAFWPLFGSDDTWVSVAFYVFGLMLGLFMITSIPISRARATSSTELVPQSAVTSRVAPFLRRRSIAGTLRP